MDLSHNKRTRQLRGEGTLLFLFKYHQVSRKFTAKEEKKKKKKDSQTVGYWCVVFTSIRRSERTFLGTTVIFLKKLQMCLQMKNTLFHGSPVPRKWLSRCSLTNGRDPPGALWQMKVSSLIGKTPVTCFCRKASALFLP